MIASSLQLIDNFTQAMSFTQPENGLKHMIHISERDLPALAYNALYLKRDWHDTFVFLLRTTP